jgi:hypothetical protein
MMLTISSDRMAMPSPFDAARLACSLDQPPTQPRRRPRTLASINLSPILIVSPPTSAGSVATVSSTFPPASCSTQARTGATSVLGERRGRRHVAATMPRDFSRTRASYSELTSARTANRPRSGQEQGEVQRLRAIPWLAEQLLDRSCPPMLESHSRAIHGPGNPLIASQPGGKGQVSLPHVDRSVALTAIPKAASA